MQGLLGSWNASSDPCADSWAFVSCACADVYPPPSAAACANVTADPAAQRVLVLGIGPVTQTEGRQLAGTLPACLGNLSALRTLDLHGNLLHVRAPARQRLLLHLACFCLGTSSCMVKVKHRGSWHGFLSMALKESLTRELLFLSS